MIESSTLYVALIGLYVVERIVELVITARHARQLRDRGGFAVGDSHYGWMVLVHTAFLISCPLEVVFGLRPFVPWLGFPALGLLVASMCLRYWAIATLGDRWTTRIFVVPGEPAVTGGPYRFVRHPNYVAVVIEIACLPLVHGAWMTALVFSVANILVLRARISAEEAALDTYSEYQTHFGATPRLVPLAERIGSPGGEPDHE